MNSFDSIRNEKKHRRRNIHYKHNGVSDRFSATLQIQTITAETGRKSGQLVCYLEVQKTEKQGNMSS